MDDPALVGAAQGGRDLDAERDRLVDSERPSVEPGPERPSGDERHDEPGPLGRRSGVEEPDEAFFFPERGDEPALALEAGEALGPGPREELQGRHVSAGRADPVDDPHAAPAELGQDLVRADHHRREDGIAPAGALATRILDHDRATVLM